jgi:hypothetical protein
VRLQDAVELVEHNARLHYAAAVLRVDLEDAVQVLRRVEHQRFAHGLP